jgi:hypothetical protein
MSEDGPVEGVAVNGGLLGVRATDAGGYYSFAGVPYGSSYTITPQSGGWTFAPVSHSGTLSNDLNFDFNATSTAGETTSFGGIVTRDGETPVADALVTLFTEVGSEMVVAAASGLVYRTTTDLYGRFSFSSIPVGSYSFTAEKQGIIITASTVEVSDTSSEVELQTASQSLLSTPAYALWNSFLGMQSVLELQNKTDREVGIRIQLLNSVSGIVSPNTHFVTVAGNQKLDVLLSALDGYSENAYGLIRIESESSFFDGGVSVYRPSDDSAGSFDFGFYVPLVNSVVGTSYVHYNTFYPGASADSVVFNWLTIANPSDEAAEFRVTYYDDRGVVQEETLYTVSAQSRVDADGGHGVRGASRAGLIKITPLNVSVPYYSLQTRYGYNSALRHYEFAGASHSQSANGAEQFIPVTSLQNMNSYLEVGNTSMGRATIELAWLDSQGEAVVEQAYRLGSAATIHVPLLSTVSEGFSGMLRLRSEGSAICAQSLNYQFDDSGNVLEATLARPFEGFASTLSGSYNLFLGMRNWLRLFNLSDQASAVLIDFGEDGGELIVNLSAYSRKDIALHEFELSENSYGAFSLQSGRPGALGAEAVRVIQSTSLEHPLQNSLPLR